jgi:hypothetical protein
MVCTRDDCAEQREVLTQNGQDLCLKHAVLDGYCIDCGERHIEQLNFMDKHGVCRFCRDADEGNYLDRLDRVYRVRSERIVNTGTPEQDFNAELAELRANLREMRLVLAEIGRAMGPWDWEQR